MSDQEQIPLEPKTPEVEKGIIPRDVVQEMEEGYLDYAMSVIVSRALPDVRDGLKPVHRRILYTMHQLSMSPGSKHKKSARLVGEVMGKYHPHGDSSIYDAMVRMAQDWSLRYPLVEGQGNFGSIDGDSPAAMRYTEARMEKLTPEMLLDIEKNTVDFRENYDGTQREPVVLPSKLPNLLLNGVGGIAVGMATNIPPHNLGELIDGIMLMIEKPDCTIEELMEKIPGPDFPTGGTIYNQAEFKRGYTTGRGKVVMRGKAEIIEKDRGKHDIIITEIPYQVNRENLIVKIAYLVQNKIITGISDVRNESDRNGMRVVVELKKDAYPRKILNQLYKLTQLQDSFHMNMIALVARGRQPRLLSLKAILKEYLDHRKEVICRRTQYELDLAERRAHILEGLKIALDHIDAIIKTIRASNTKEEAKVALMSEFKLSDRQAQAILEMRLQTLAGLERKKIENEYQEKMTMIADFKDILARPERVFQIIEDDLAHIKSKYSDKRRSIIVPEGIDGFKNEDLIPNETVIITLTKSNYIKRMNTQTYKAQKRGGKGVSGTNTKSNDVIQDIVVANNHDSILFFTSRGRVFKTKIYEIPAASRTARGAAVASVVQLDAGEDVTSILILPKKGDDKFNYFFMGTALGTVKKSKIDDFQNIRKSGLIAIKLKDNDSLKWVRQTTGENQIMLVTKQGQSIRFDENDVRSMGRASSGVRGVRLKNEVDEVVEMSIVPFDEDTNYVMTISEKGFGKCTLLKHYKVQNRGGSGLKTHMVTKKTGPVVGAKIISSKDGDLILMSKKGQVIRMKLKEVKTTGRATQGVTVMRMKKTGDAVITFTLYNEDAFEAQKEESKSGDQIDAPKESPTLM